MDSKIAQIEKDIVEIKLEIKPLERLPDKLDELIRSQQEFMQLLSQNYVSEKSCLERRGAADKEIAATNKKIDEVKTLINNFAWGAAGTVIAALGYFYQVTHK